MRRWYILVPIFGIICLLVYGMRSTTSVKEIRDVTRVFMHEPDRYTLYYQDPAGTDTVKVLTFRVGGPDQIVLLADVQTSGRMFATLTVRKTPLDGEGIVRVTLHLRRPVDVEGGGWDHGKSGRGTTVIVGQ